MPTATLVTKYRKNTGVIMSSDEIMALYFYGVGISSKDGSKLDIGTINMYIEAAQREIERVLDIRLPLQLVTESLTYYRDDYQHGYPFLRTSLPVNIPYSLSGILNSVQQIRYPKGWLSYKTSSTGQKYRQVGLVPNGSTVEGDANVILLGITAQYGLRSQATIPNYWTIQYDTGFTPEDMPMEIINLVGMLGSIGLFAQAGDLILGAGISSQSLSLDGVSSSISSTSSATNSGYGARIIEYRKSIKETINNIKRSYKGITFAAL